MRTRPYDGSRPDADALQVNSLTPRGCRQYVRPLMNKLLAMEESRLTKIVGYMLKQGRLTTWRKEPYGNPPKC